MNIVRVSSHYSEPFNHPVNIMKTSRDILAMVSGIYNVSKEAIIGRGTADGLATIRHEFFYRSVKLPGMNTHKLAHIYGFHYTTVAYGISKHAYKNNKPRVSGCDYGVETRRKCGVSRVSYHVKRYAHMKSLAKKGARYELSECQEACRRLKFYWKSKGYIIKASPRPIRSKYNMKKNYTIQTDLVFCVPVGFKYVKYTVPKPEVKS